MRGYLLDTSVALIGATEPERLSAVVRRAIEHGPVYISTVSYWEVVIKAMKGTLGEIGEPRRWWIRTLEDLALRVLPQSTDHIAAICDLPPLHSDPFDRALIAQAIVEELTLVTTDREIPKYASRQFRVLAN